VLGQPLICQANFTPRSSLVKRETVGAGATKVVKSSALGRSSSEPSVWR